MLYIDLVSWLGDIICVFLVQMEQTIEVMGEAKGMLGEKKRSDGKERKNYFFSVFCFK